MARMSERSGQDDLGGEFEEKVLYINRCAKVVKGGKRMSFSALILIGNRNGKIGVGFAKANEVSDAIRKGSAAARKNVISIVMEKNTIPHEVRVSWDGAELMLKPAKEGTGVVAGSKVRAVLELAGVKDVIAKSQGSTNPLNTVRATIEALQELRPLNDYLKERGLVE
ncbi:MAG: 30S ribosomal protein S5 [Chlamydiae bacterium]|nr:30S ribosomal protein S5 [Chlamydiota bacterium]